MSAQLTAGGSSRSQTSRKLTDAWNQKVLVEGLHRRRHPVLGITREMVGKVNGLWQLFAGLHLGQMDEVRTGAAVWERGRSKECGEEWGVRCRDGEVWIAIASAIRELQL